MSVLELLDAQTLLVFSVVFLVTWWYWETRLPGGFPPGPWRIPILGSMMALAKYPGKFHLSMMELAQEYGPVTGMKMGSYPTIILNDYDTSQEALIKQGEFLTERPQYLATISDMFRPHKGGPIQGLVWTNGDMWKYSRRLALTNMRDFGIGKKSHEYKILEEAVSLCEEFATVSGRSFGHVFDLLQECANNIMCNVIYGNRFEKGDPDFVKLMERQRDSFSTEAYNSITNFVPLFRLFPSQTWQQRLMENKEKDRKWKHEQIEKRRYERDEMERSSFVDLCLANENKSDDLILCPDNIKQIMDDIYNGGSENIATMMNWALLYMMVYPETQHKCQEEIDRMIGQARLPAATDQSKMPYINAVVHESLRLASIVPIDMHIAACDTTLCGYKIPKNTLVLVNIHGIHRDVNYWDDPEEFRPERWLTPGGGFQKQEAFVPFSIGYRVCPGESIAKTELFLLLSALLQRFNFRLPNPDKPPSLESIPGMTYGPKDYQIIADPRE